MGRLSLSGGRLGYVDANVLIHMVEGLNGFAITLKLLADAIDSGTFRVVTSELSLAEVLVKPLAQGNVALIDVFNFLVGGGSKIEVVPVSRSILVAAAEIRTRHKLKLPDAIHWATAVASNCAVFLSQDGDFQDPALPGAVTLLELDP
jgi:predicted nucleic acid-binding protein